MVYCAEILMSLDYLYVFIFQIQNLEICYYFNNNLWPENISKLFLVILHFE